MSDASRSSEWESQPSVRRDGHAELPAGPKARRTRARILAAATAAFTARGYLRTTMSDIAAEAGVSLGTVYQYFRDRPDVVAALVDDSVARMRARTDTVWRASEGVDGLRRVVGNFVESYAAVAPMAGVWEEVCHTDERMADLRREFNRLFIGSVERELRRAAAAGLVRDDLDVAIVARALTAMVDRYCYVTYVLDQPVGGAPDAAQSAEVLTRLWAASIGLAPRGGRAPRTSDRRKS